MAITSSISSINGSYKPSVNVLVDRFLDVERAPIKRLEASSSNISTRVSALTNLKTKLKTLYDRVQTFSDVGTANKIGAKSAESSNSTIFTATAEANATIGVNSIFVSQIAKNDTVVSDRITADDTDIAEKYVGSTISFSLKIGSENAVTISIDVDDATETNAELLTRIKDAINSAGANVSANLISDTSTTKRLTIVTDETGSSNAIELTDLSSPKFLKDIGMINGEVRKLASGTAGGYIYEDTSDLNANFTLNGIQIEADSNEVDDVLTGVTLTLKKTQDEDDQPETLVVTQDEETIKEQIEGFIKDYNEVVKYINEKTTIDTTTFTRGIFTSDYIIRNLRTNLRSIVSGNVSTVESGNPANLTEMGISIDSKGLLSLEDEDEFSEALEEGATAITDLFDSAQGIAIQLEDKIEGFVSVGGVIDDARSASNLKITGINKRISSIESKLKFTESGLKRKFSDLQKILSTLNSQQSILSQFGFDNYSNFGFSQSGSGGISLLS